MVSVVLLLAQIKLIFITAAHVCYVSDLWPVCWLHTDVFADFAFSKPCQGLCFSHCSTRLGVVKSWEETEPGHWPQWPEGCPALHDAVLSGKGWGKGGRRGDTWIDGVCLPQPALGVKEPCFPGSGWTPAHQWEVVNELLVLFGWQLLFYLLSLPHPMSFLTFTLPVLSCCRGMSEWLAGAELLMGQSSYPQYVGTSTVHLILAVWHS